MSELDLTAVKFNDDGLVPAIAQDILNGDVLMMAWMNAESLQRTIDEGRMVYWSRSRQELWRKGDTSGDHQVVREAYYDCDGDTLLFKVEQHGAGACHTGERTCFFTPIPGVRGRGTPTPGLRGRGTPIPGLRGRGTPIPGLRGRGTPTDGLRGRGTPTDVTATAR